SLALVLDQIGFRVTLVDGGYKAFRAALLADLPRLAQRLNYRVICGPTGSGKTRLLQALKAGGAQVLDLEALANHRSSVLGMIPGVQQPSQKAFDSFIWAALRGFAPARPVYIESESKKVGNVAVPDSLIAAMRTSPCLDLQLSDDERVALLLEDYDFFIKDTAYFCDRLDALVELRGKAVVTGWKEAVAAGRLDTVVRALLALHYDPGYARSMERNFGQYPQATPITATDRTMQTMASLAQAIINKDTSP
ncbi:MAG: tRNA 2-selenouridine(34) synthase MnmH, partial [Polaromonas sp.]